MPPSLNLQTFLHLLKYVHMKIAKEYQLLIIGGLFILAYVLEALVNPLTVKLATPYSFLSPVIFLKYPFTSAVIVIKSIALFWTPLLLMSFIQKAYAAKGSVLLVLAGLLQLYSLQEIATGAQVIPLEWSLSFSVAGLLLLIPTVILFLRHGLSGVQTKMYPQPANPDQSLMDDDDDD